MDGEFRRGKRGNPSAFLTISLRASASKNGALAARNGRPVHTLRYGPCAGLSPQAAFICCAPLPVVLIKLNSIHIMNIPLTPLLANMTPTTMIFVFFILLMMFGAKKLPDLAKGLGQAIREFSKAKNDVHDEIMREANSQPRIETPAQTAAVPPPAGTQPAAAATQPVAPVQHTETHA